MDPHPATRGRPVTTSKAPTAEASLRAAVREAHGVLKDMRGVLADLRAERRAVEQLLDGIPGRVDERIERQVVEGLEALGRQTEQAMDASVAKVGREFDRLAAIFLGTDERARAEGREPLETLVLRNREAAGLPEVVHRCPPLGASLMPCCAQWPSDIPRTDRLTMDPALVTCTGRSS